MDGMVVDDGVIGEGSEKVLGFVELVLVVGLDELPFGDFGHLINE